MKRFPHFVFSFMILAAMFSSPSAALAERVPGERIGVKFNILSGFPGTFPANSPFHFAHGWGIDKTQSNLGLGRYGFYLALDGVQVPESFFEQTYTKGDIGYLWVFNFPAGLPAGTYTFTGRWVGPCKPLTELTVFPGPYPGPCQNPVEVVDALVQNLIVEFTP